MAGLCSIIMRGFFHRVPLWAQSCATVLQGEPVAELEPAMLGPADASLLGNGWELPVHWCAFHLAAGVRFCFCISTCCHSFVDFYGLGQQPELGCCALKRSSNG